MKKIPRQKSKRWLTGAAAGLATFTGEPRVAGANWVAAPDLSIRRAATPHRFARGHEHVLGTSLDVIVEAAHPAEAAACEARLLGEIERLRKIFSTYDPASEISRVMAGAPVESAELAELFAAYETWAARTDGLVAANLGGVIDEWREAARTGRPPDPAALARAAQRSRAFNVDALGKGFIIDRAVAVARQWAPGGLLNLGGDLRAWGDTAWRVGVADPQNPADNAPPLARFALRDAAVATSGGYARFFHVGGKRFSHLIDPRTLRPLAPGGGATVVARDCVTANALSTAASIGGADTGLRLARENEATGFLFADAAGNVTRGGVLAPTATAQPAPSGAEEKSPPAAKDAGWPAGFQVTVQVALKNHTEPKRTYRPYVVVWIEDAQNRVVRTLALWGEDPRYQRKLGTWMRLMGDTEAPYMAGRATRAPGAYSLGWNGTDHFGRRVPAGNYTVRLELCREDGPHVVTAAKVECGREPYSATLAETAESDASTVSYGPGKS